MAVRVAINGFGRIGRNFLRACFEKDNALKEKLEIVAINDIGSIEALAHLLKFDTSHGIFSENVSCSEKEQVLQVGDKKIRIFNESDPAKCNWNDVDIVVEATGNFRAREDAALHLKAGAKKVVIAAVAFDEVDATIVMGVNESELKGDEKIISAASCTTHCIAPVLSRVEKHHVIKSVFMTEMHAYTSDQVILDHVHRDLRRARSGAQNMIPTTSSSIGAVQKVLPDLENKVNGYSMRVPINNVAAVDLCITVEKKVEAEEINRLFKDYPDKDLIAYSDLPLVSSDFNHRSESAIFDGTQTQVLENTFKILVWYDNEWAYVNRLMEMLCCMDLKS